MSGNKVGVYRLRFRTVDGKKKPLAYEAEIIAQVQPEDWIAEDSGYIARALRKCSYGKADIDKLKESTPVVTLIRICDGILGGLKFKTDI